MTTRIIGDAIAARLDPIVPVSTVAEAHLLQAGAFMDAAGGGFKSVQRDYKARAFANIRPMDSKQR